MKKSLENNLNGTFVYEVTSEVPIRPSMLGKIRKSNLCDNLEIIHDYRIRITKSVTDGSVFLIDWSDHPTDREMGWGNRMAELMQNEMEKLLHSCSRYLTIRRVRIFLT